MRLWILKISYSTRWQLQSQRKTVCVGGGCSCILQFPGCSLSWLDLKQLLNAGDLQWNQQCCSQYRKIQDAWGIAVLCFGSTLTIHLSDMLSRASTDDGQYSTSLATQSILCFFLLHVFCFLVVNTTPRNHSCHYWTSPTSVALFLLI